jgi:hypothetical protein
MAVFTKRRSVRRAPVKLATVHRRIQAAVVVSAALAATLWWIYRRESWAPSFACNVLTSAITIWIVNLLIAGGERRRGLEAARAALISPLVRLGDAVIRTAAILRDKELQQRLPEVAGGWRSGSTGLSQAIQYAMPDVDSDVRDALRRLEKLVSKIADDVPKFSISRLDRDLALVWFAVRDFGPTVYESDVLEFKGAEELLVSLGLPATPDGKLDRTRIL